MEPKSSGAVTRRRFLEVTAAAGVSAALASPVMALAQGASGGKAAPSASAPPAASAPKPDDKKPSEFAPDAEAMTTVIRRRYGQHLDDAQMKDVTDELDQRMQLGKALRAVKLDNGTEPEAMFHA